MQPSCLSICRFSAVAGFAIALSALAACSGPSALSGALSGAAVAAYTRSNSIVVAGYSEKAIDPTHYEVRATGTDSTPKARVEHIALARAAEIGIEGKMRYFKIENIRHGVQCGKKQESYKAKPLPAFHYPTVTLDVAYANGAAPPDASWLVAADSFAATTAELNGQSFAAEDTAATAAAVKAACPGA